MRPTLGEYEVTKSGRVAVLIELEVSLKNQRLLFVYDERAGSKVQHVCGQTWIRVIRAEQLGWYICT
jgi:hypothetical protein